MSQKSLPCGMERGRHYDFGGPIDTKGRRVAARTNLEADITVTDGELVGQNRSGSPLFRGFPLGEGHMFEFHLSAADCGNATVMDPPRIGRVA